MKLLKRPQSADTLNEAGGEYAHYLYQGRYLKPYEKSNRAKTDPFAAVRISEKKMPLSDARNTSRLNF